MVWAHTHRDGTYARHEDGIACGLDQPEKLRGQIARAVAVDEVAAFRPEPLITEPLTVEVTVGAGGYTPPRTFDASSSVKEAVAALELAGPDPAYSAGRVDFADMLKTDAQWSLKHRFDALLGRPYLATQLAAMLPADVALRLVERAEAVIAIRVNEQMDQLMAELSRTTEDTIERLANEAAAKREELKRERFGRPTRLS